MGRPNELSEQVVPNTLSTSSGRRPSTPPVGGAPSWTSGGGSTATGRGVAPLVPAASAATRRTSPGRPVRRPFGVWGLIVAVIVGFNLFRAFGSNLGGTDATARPVAQATAFTEPTRTAGSGTVAFGAQQGSDCTLPEPAATFDAGTRVYWWAQFGHDVDAPTRVTWSLTHDGQQLESGGGPDDSPSAPWDGICGNEPVRYFAVGTYTLDVWTVDKSERLATGTFTLRDAGKGPSPTAS